jgi:FimV-like protein
MLPLPLPEATLTVAQGDTAAGIASRIKPAEVSSEQALLALYRLNIEAFDGSIHRLRAKTVLKVPTLEAMKAVSVTCRPAQIYVHWHIQ